MSFYHDFAIGFNLWYILAPLYLVLMVCVGAKRYRFRISDGSIRKRYKDCLLDLAGTLGGMWFAFDFAFESGHGVVQLVDNFNPTQGPMWSILMLLCAMVGVGFMYGLLCTSLANIASRFCYERQHTKQVMLRSVRDGRGWHMDPDYPELWIKD